MSDKCKRAIGIGSGKFSQFLEYFEVNGDNIPELLAQTYLNELNFEMNQFRDRFLEIQKFFNSNDYEQIDFYNRETQKHIESLIYFAERPRDEENVKTKLVKRIALAKESSREVGEITLRDTFKLFPQNVNGMK